VKEWVVEPSLVGVPVLDGRLSVVRAVLVIIPTGATLVLPVFAPVLVGVRPFTLSIAISARVPPLLDTLQLRVTPHEPEGDNAEDKRQTCARQDGGQKPFDVGHGKPPLAMRHELVRE
jgi:hypothetical protein